MALTYIVDARPLDLMRREADIALRPTQQPPDLWVGRQLLPIECAVYAHKDYWQRARDWPAQAQRWIVLEELDQSPMSLMTQQAAAPHASITRVNTVIASLALTQAGLGLCALPTYLGDGQSDLLRVVEPEARFTWDLWVLAHSDVRRNARVQAFYAFISKALKARDTIG